MKRLVLLLALLAAVCCAGETTLDNNTPGANILLSQSAFDQVNRELMPYVLALVNKQSFPDMEASTKVPVLGTMSIKVHKVHISKLISVTSTAIQIVNNGIQFKGLGLSGALKGDFAWKQHSFPYASGSGKFTASISNSEVLVTAFIGTQTNGRPHVVMNGNIHVKGFSIKIDEGIVGWLAERFVELFKSNIISEIDKAANKAISSLTPLFQGHLDALPIPWVLPRIPLMTTRLLFDWSIVSTALRSPVSVFGSRALVTNGNYTGKPQPIPTSVDGDMFNFVLSKNSLQSALHALYESKSFEYLYDDKKITTDVFESVLPQMAKLYPHTPMTFLIKPKNEPLFNTSDKCAVGWTAQAEVIAHIVTDPPVVAFVVIGEMATAVSVAFKGTDKNVLTARIEQLALSIKSADSPFGQLDLAFVDKVIKNVLEAAVAIANAELEQGYVISPFFGMQLFNGSVKSARDWLGLGLSLKPVH